MKLLSDASEYGLRAMVWLSQQPTGVYKLQEIAEGTKAPPGYLIKALQALAKAGIVSTHRGSAGGFSLVRRPDDVSVLDVIAAIDPIERIRSCPLGLDAHARFLCPMHQRIDDALAQIERTFGASVIAELVDRSAASDDLCSGLCGTRAAEESDQKSP